MFYKLKLITPPPLEPVSLPEAKEAARILTSDFDGIIPGLIKAGREHAESYQGICYLTQTWKLIFDCFPLMPFEMPKKPLQSLDTVEYINCDGVKQAMALTDFIVSTDTNRIGFKTGKCWPSVTLQEFDGLIFTFKAGVTDVNKVPETVKLAIKLFVCENIDRPDNPEVPKGFYDLLRPNRHWPV